MSQIRKNSGNVTTHKISTIKPDNDIILESQNKYFSDKNSIIY